LVGVGDLVPQAGEDALAQPLITVGALGVVADDEAVAHGAVVDAHLLDAQAAVDDVVAALAGQRGVRLGAVGAQLLADDVVAAGALQGAAVAHAVDTSGEV